MSRWFCQSRPRPRTHGLSVAVVALAVCLVSHRGAGVLGAGLAIAQPAPSAQPAATSSTSPTLTLSATVDRTTLTVIDPITLTLELRIPIRDAATGEPIAANPALSPDPTSGQPLGDLLVSSVRRDPPQLVSDHLLHRWIITLEPQLPGPARIPSINATLTPAQLVQPSSPTPAHLASPVTITASEPIELSISSVLDAATDFTPGQVRPPLDPTPQPASRSTPAWLLPSIIAFLAGALGVLGFLSTRPTPRRRVRRAFAPLHTLARALTGSRQPADDPGRALAAADLIRDASTLALGPAARAATPDELAALLSPPGVPTPPAPTPAQLATITPLLTWADSRRYGALTTPPPPLPDLPALLRNLEQAALNNLDKLSGARPA